MALDISRERGVPLDRQVFTWRELADSVRETREAEVDLRASGTEFIDASEEDRAGPTRRCPGRAAHEEDVMARREKHEKATTKPGLGQDDLSVQFREAANEEERHLARVRRWLTRAVAGQAGVEAPLSHGDAGAPRGVPAP